ncbi:MAG: hypothetical protein H7223_01145 [Pedobacter sp.]|nr:hypothetical protein [Pedobacter sp.]
MKRSITGLLLALPMLSMGQPNYQKGYIVNNSMDTLKGYIDYKPKVNTVPSISFRQELNSPAQAFTPNSAKGYGFNGAASFESFNVRISNGSTKTEGLKVGIDTSSRRAFVFLKVLQRGPNVTIYSYTDEIKERFYIKGNASTAPYELIRMRYIEANNSSKVVGADRYKGQLLFEMRSYNAGTEFFEADFDDLAYSETEMIKVAAMINRMQVRVAKKGFRFFVGAGVGGTGVKYTGQNPLANAEAIAITSYMPSFNVGIDMAAKTLAERLIYRAELSLFMGKDTKVTYGQYIHSFDHTTLYLSPKLLYNVYNTTMLKVYAGIGAGASYSSYSNIKSGKTVSVAMSPDDFDKISIDLKPSAFSYNLNFGFAIRKIEVTAMYTPHFKISDYAGFNVLMGIMHAGIKYRFD